MSTPDTPLPDLTRWNRTGLSRFDYVDGDASVWLEELRIAMLGLYLHDGDAAARLPEYWRDIYLRNKGDWPDVAKASAQVAWKRLAPDMPPHQETRGQRSGRLLRQYQDHTEDYGWEINRAFARASHILLGYLDAYANEGYLRTATQWDNLRRLAAMVNYQPTPPASATTLVGLILKDAPDTVRIAAGLALKHTPAEGGAPLVFETLTEIDAHSALNAARVVQWDHNTRAIPAPTAPQSRWQRPSDTTMAIGDLAVLAQHDDAEALIVSSVSQDEDLDAVRLHFADPPRRTYRHNASRLWVAPDDVRVGRRASRNAQVVIKADNTGAVVKGDLLEVFVNGKKDVVEVVSVDNGEMVIEMALPAPDATILVRPMLAFDLQDGRRIERVVDADETMWVRTLGAPQGERPTEADGEAAKKMKLMGYHFSGAKGGRAFAQDKGGPKAEARMRRRSAKVLPSSAASDATQTTISKTVTFLGKPPKGLKDGAWFVARAISTDTLQALQVKGIRVAAGEYHVAFNTAPQKPHEHTEFHGPMTLALPHMGYDRNPFPAINGNKITLAHIPAAARALVKPGNTVFIRLQNDTEDRTVAARVDSAAAASGDRLVVALAQYEEAQHWPAGAVTFCFNTVQISHGASKDSKVLGSGDGERSAQVFDFDIKNVSHIPSTVSESGVAPDMTLTVDGERWDHRDFIDPTATGTKSWSSTLKEDGTLRVHFRRRLVSGQNNVIVARYRVGAGISGANIAPYSFAKPMHKHRHIAAVVQPFATAGGADREPVSKLRTSAPKRLSSNGRAVSLADFEHLAARHSAILHAKAAMVPSAGSHRLIEVTVALTGGGDVALLTEDLVPSLTARALPGVAVAFCNYTPLLLRMAVSIRADLSVHNRTDIKAAALAQLKESFALKQREFGQTTYISEVMAALETVAGIDTVIVTDFGLEPPPTTLSVSERRAQSPRKVATKDGRITAIYAGAQHITHLSETAAAVTINVEAST